MDKCCQHQKIFNRGKTEYYFFAWSIPEVSLVYNLNVQTREYVFKDNYTYHAFLCGSEDKITFRIVSTSRNLKCFASIIMGSKTLLHSNDLRQFTSSSGCTYYYDLVTLSSEDEAFQILKKNQNNTLDLACNIMQEENLSSKSMTASETTSIDNIFNLRTLAAVLRNSPETMLKEKVVLKVGEETETVSKAVLCSQSLVFKKMFENNMKEVKENMVTITDITMPVFKVFLTFLYTGEVLSNELGELYDLYYVADKYEVACLRQICIELIKPKISMSNIVRVVKLAFFYNDEFLKLIVMGLIATNVETWFSSNNWKNLVDDEPKIAAEVLQFLDS